MGSSSPLLSRISTSLSRTGVPEQLKQTSPHLGLSKKKTDFTAPFTLSGSGRILPGQEFPSHSKHHARLGFWDLLHSKRRSRVQHTVSWRPGSVGRAKPEQTGSWTQACQSSPQPPQLRPKAAADRTQAQTGGGLLWLMGGEKPRKCGCFGGHHGTRLWNDMPCVVRPRRQNHPRNGSERDGKRKFAATDISTGPRGPTGDFPQQW